MLDVGAGELCIVLLVAALALGPQRTAGFMRRIARWLESADARWRDFTRSIEDENGPR